MIRRKHETLRGIYMAMDALAANLALLAAYYLRFAVEVIPVTKGTQEIEIYTHTLPLVTIIFPLAFAIQGLYRIRPVKSRAEEWVSAAIAVLLGTVVLSGVLLWIRPSNPDVNYSRATLGLFAVCNLLFVMAGRSVVRHVLERRFRAGRNLDRVLIVGSGELAAAVVDRMRTHQELGLRLVGFVSDDERTSLDLARLGSLADAEQVIRDNNIDHVFIALPQESSTEMMALLNRLTREYVSIHVIPDLLQFMALRSRVEDLEGLPTINLTETPLDGWSRFVKRGFDLLFAAFALIVWAPVMAAIAILIWIEDRGPVFYRQIRMGLDGVPFQIVKFRSMKRNAENDTGAVWAEKDDPRRTRVGQMLRTWSLDELPQLWNVLRGDMSLVGPRPERPQFVEQFRTEFPHYMLRHKVRAGMTGWAQVHGWRGNTSMRMRIEHDLYYIENWSLLLDLKILFLTLRQGLRHENAY
jgi:exopolysaccharide biosynthesis polyprenyl glycosylphosphotransferase